MEQLMEPQRTSSRSSDGPFSLWGFRFSSFGSPMTVAFPAAVRTRQPSSFPVRPQAPPYIGRMLRRLRRPTRAAFPSSDPTVPDRRTGECGAQFTTWIFPDKLNSATIWKSEHAAAWMAPVHQGPWLSARPHQRRRQARGSALHG